MNVFQFRLCWDLFFQDGSFDICYLSMMPNKNIKNDPEYLLFTLNFISAVHFYDIFYFPYETS